MAFAASNLFGAPQQQQQQGQAPALTFRAGKMHKTGTTVRADTRKGQIVIVGDQSFIHFQWKDRVTGVIEDDLMVFKDEAEYFKVEKCTTGRVYILQFKQGANAAERFFWMQEPSDEKDEEYCRLINSYMKNPMKCVPGGESGPSVSNQLEQMLMNARRPQNRDAAPPQRPAGGAIDMDTLQSILSDLSGGRGGAQGQAQGQAPAAQQAQQQQQQQRAPDVELTDLFSQESVRQVLSGEPASFEQRLSEHFPEGIETSVLEEIRTPQFRQSLELLQAALSDPNARAELTQAFQLPASTEGGRGGVDQFIRCILAWHEQQKK